MQNGHSKTQNLNPEFFIATYLHQHGAEQEEDRDVSQSVVLESAENETETKNEKRKGERGEGRGARGERFHETRRPKAFYLRSQVLRDSRPK